MTKDESESHFRCFAFGDNIGLLSRAFLSRSTVEIWVQLGCNTYEPRKYNAKPANELARINSWFGTRGSEVQILSPRPTNSTTYKELKFRRNPLCTQCATLAAPNRMRRSLVYDQKARRLMLCLCYFFGLCFFFAFALRTFPDALPAFLAISLRRSALNFLARATPPALEILAA